MYAGKTDDRIEQKKTTTESAWIVRLHSAFAMFLIFIDDFEQW